ncbi:serpin family protein [Plantactinospora sp. KBS50]|uniref:serpin family protein n=1 Tax=Plantactinospora sp. KBS50 TaxID=2024580 RepID=UPI000BAAD593|nr:serpin family protein [Plantactinospora sp. KBS50]ASW53146.1 hypothetical protein CIK06_01515 [Plantactinospora sp. KBS50]
MSVAAVNALTARWAGTVREGEGTVLSGAGAYPLLALLSRYAAGVARTELVAVAGSPFPALDSPEIRLAVAAWLRDEVPPSPQWLALPESLRGRLTGDPATDQAALDRWAAANTGDLIRKLPAQVIDETMMILASALSVVTTWRWPFTERPCNPTSGPWQGRSLLGLGRDRFDPAGLRVVETRAGIVTLLSVPGAEDVDVVLALGPADQPAGRVLPAAIGALPALAAAVRAAAADSAGAADSEGGTDTAADSAGGTDSDGVAVTVRPVADGPGVTVRRVRAYDDRPELTVLTVAFSVQGEHDLLERADLFGLAAATDRSQGHFPGISAQPLAVSQARQSAMATFGAVGFKAAAVTALGMVAAGAIRQPSVEKELTTVCIDRPFGFLAVHRATGLVLVAGWVTDPDPYR